MSLMLALGKKTFLTVNPGVNLSEEEVSDFPFLLTSSLPPSRLRPRSAGDRRQGTERGLTRKLLEQGAEVTRDFQ